MKRNPGWFQQFSERYYHPYSRWWFSWRSNLTIGILALSGLLIFYLSTATS